MGDHEFNNYDDKLYITENPHALAGWTSDGVMWAFTATHASNWHPLTWLSHLLDCELYGLNPKGHLFTNVLLHIVNTVLLFLLLRRMTGALWRSGFVAALFALHPLHVESVAWVAERKDVLSTLFWILTIWTYVRYVERPGTKRYLPILLSFALGLMAKPMLVTLPFVLLLLDYWPLERFRVGQLDGNKEVTKGIFSDLREQRSLVFSLLWEKVPLFVLTVASSLVTFFAQKAGGSVGTWESYPLKIRIANALVSYLKYIGKMIWPQNLAVFYPHAGASLPMWQIVGAGVLLVSITVLAIRAAPRRPYLAVGWLWYLGTLIPVMGLLQVGAQAMADRYTYVPLIGLFIMIAWGVSELAMRWKYGRIALAISSCVLLLGLMSTSWAQVRHWKNSITLFEHALKVTKNNYIAHNNLGAALEKQGKIEDATVHYIEALRIKPYFADPLNNLGFILLEQGRNAEAISHFSRALQVRPNFAEAHNNLGVALDGMGRTDEATTHYSMALKIKPDFAEVYNNLGLALDGMGKPKEAIIQYKIALQMKRNYPEAQVNLGTALERQGKLTEAIAHYSEALRLKPDFAGAHNSLGFALAQQGKFNEATAHFNEALRIKPDYAEAHNNLGMVLDDQGKLTEAITHYSEALRLRPNLAEAHNNLGVALARQGRLAEAIEHYTEALKSKSNYAEAHNNLGVALGRQGRLDEAIDHFCEALRIKPDYSEAQRNLEFALRLAGRSR
jgi:Flp pilus assembly protein TadD